MVLPCHLSHKTFALYQGPAVRRTLNIHPAINADRLSRHIVALGDDITYTGCDLFGGTETGHGDFFEDALADVLWHLPEHIRLCEAWTHGVDRDAVAGHL